MKGLCDLWFTLTCVSLGSSEPYVLVAQLLLVLLFSILYKINSSSSSCGRIFVRRKEASSSLHWNKNNNNRNK